MVSAVVNGADFLVVSEGVAIGADLNAERSSVYFPLTAVPEVVTLEEQPATNTTANMRITRRIKYILR